VGLLPAAIFVLVVYLVSKGGWVGAFIAAVIAILALGGFASLVAGIARTNTVRRTYVDEVLPELQRAMQPGDQPARCNTGCRCLPARQRASAPDALQHR
jgi:hypothetical protein